MVAFGGLEFPTTKQQSIRGMLNLVDYHEEISIDTDDAADTSSGGSDVCDASGSDG